MVDKRKGLLVYVNLSRHATTDYEVEELSRLSESSNVDVCSKYLISADKPNARTYIGKGHVDSILKIIADKECCVIVFNHNLPPTHQRNLARIFKREVIDRTTLILDIFASRARSFEGKLQVELAQLTYSSNRLVREWTHLERQKGGIGLRGPGEKQLETDRRLIRKRIQSISRQLSKVIKQREQSNRNRRRKQTPLIALIGYTNAGKSTLFNVLTQSSVGSSEKLFETLDPTTRQLRVPGLPNIVISDTVGFINNLPKELIAAFKATIEQITQASLLCHVIDSSDPLFVDKIAPVNNILCQIGAENIPQILVYNKCDLLDRATLALNTMNRKSAYVSAMTQEGIDHLKWMIGQQLRINRKYYCIYLSHELGYQRAHLYDINVVLSEYICCDGWWLSVEIDVSTWKQIMLHNS